MEDTHGGWQGVTGLRQTQKAVAKGLAARVYLACDADPALTEPLMRSIRNKIPLFRGKYREQSPETIL